MPSVLHDLFYRVLDEYGNVFDEVYRTRNFANSFGSIIRNDIPAAFLSHSEIDQNVYKIEGKCGIGQWAAIPYIVVFDKRVTRSAKKGAYIVYLVNKEKKEMTLAFGIGTTEGAGMYSPDSPAVVASSSRKLSADVLVGLRAKCKSIREALNVTQLEFSEANFCGSAGYDAACIYNKKYTLETLPDDDQLVSDLLSFLVAYKKYFELYVGGASAMSPKMLDHWPTGARDTTQFPMVSIDVNAKFREHLEAFLKMDGLDWNDYDGMRETGGLAISDQRYRTYRKMYEKFGLLFKHEGKVKLSRLGQQMVSLVPDLISQKEEVLKRLRFTATSILSRYQLKNPLDDDGSVPDDCDVLPAICFWRAMSELDWKLHPEEVNRTILRVMHMDELPDAIEKIRNARSLFSGVYRDRTDQELTSALGKSVHTDPSEMTARIDPWFSFLGWGGLLIEQSVDSFGYRNMVNESIDIIKKILDNPPMFFDVEDEDKWLEYYIGSDDEYLGNTYLNRALNINVKETLGQIKEFIRASGFSYKDELVDNFYLCLKSKPFVILAGTSGTGKTRLVKLFAKAIGAEFKLVPVRPDWSDSSDLFGHVNLNGNFVPGAILDFIHEAGLHTDKPYFLCLDEMNLARVEYYLSDFLSVIETRDMNEVGEIISDPLVPASLYGSDEKALEKYGEIRYPENLYVIGTVNMDETTFPFSKKVLDRANTIEFSFVDLKPGEAVTETVNPMNLSNDYLRSEYLLLKQCPAEDKKFIDSICVKLEEINEVLRDCNAHVGYRVRDEILFYMLNNKHSELKKEDDALDCEILQKILPRLQGSALSVKEMLCRLFVMFAKDYEGKSGDGASRKMMEVLKDNDAKYPESAKKLQMMVRRFEEDGFTSYWL